MLAVAGEAEIDLRPLEGVINTTLKGGASILRRLAGFPAMDHHLLGARWFDRFEEAETRGGGKPWPDGDQERQRSQE